MAAGRMLGGMPACRAAVRGSGPPSGACAAGAKAVGGASLGGGGDPSAASADHGQAAGARRLLPFRLRCAPPGCPPRVLPEMHAGEPAGGMRAAATAGIGGGIWAGRAAASRGRGARQIEAGLEGFEPSTAGLRVRCSTWLSHRPGTGCAGRYYKRCMRSGSGASGGPCAPRRQERPCNAPGGRQIVEIQAAAPRGVLLPWAGHGRRDARLVVLVQYRVEDDRDRHVVHALFLGQELLVGVQGNVHGDRAAAL